jgi:hypothetical protein
MWRPPAGRLAADGLASGNGPGPASGSAPGAASRALSAMRGSYGGSYDGSYGGDVTPASVDGSGSSSDSDLAGGRGPGDTPLNRSIEKWAGVTDGVDEAPVPGGDIRDGSSTQEVLDEGGQAETPGGNGEQAIMASRAYQLEMLEQSLKHNVIVAVSGTFLFLAYVNLHMLELQSR